MSALLTPLPTLTSTSAATAAAVNRAIDVVLSGSSSASISLLSPVIETSKRMASTIGRMLQDLVAAARDALMRLLNIAPKASTHHAFKGDEASENELENMLANDIDAVDEIELADDNESVDDNEVLNELEDMTANDIDAVNEVENAVQDEFVPARNGLVAKYLCPCGACPYDEIIDASVVASGVEMGERASTIRVLRAFSTYNEVIGYRRGMIPATVRSLQEWRTYEDREDRALKFLIKMYAKFRAVSVW